MGSLITEIPYSEVTATLEIFDRFGITRDDLKRFRKAKPRLKGDLARLLKYGVTSGPPVDCDADPFALKGWTVEFHQKNGQFIFDSSQVKLHLDNSQMSGRRITGTKLRQRFANKRVLNANVLDYLLTHPDLIPEEWKRNSKGITRSICFWGTVYRYPGGAVGDLYIRYLYWDGGAWSWNHFWLGNTWHDFQYAVISI